jgi:hypothetical protein
MRSAQATVLACVWRFLDACNSMTVEAQADEA